MGVRHVLLFILALAISTGTPIQTTWAAEANDDSWAEDDWGDEYWGNSQDGDSSSSPWHFSGFIEGAYGTRLQNDPAIKKDTTLGEARGRLELEYTADQWRMDAKGDLVYDDVLSETRWDTRVLALSFSPTERLDIKAGRQVLTWGTGDYVFLNDLFPKDWPSFFAGRDDEYLKAPSDSIKASWFADSFSVDLVWTPEFTADNTLNGERFSFFSPTAGRNVAPDPALDPKDPSGNTNTWSARLATDYQGVEYALYGYKGYWTMPLGMDNQGRMIYPEMNSWGASLRTGMGKGIFNTEMAWYDSRENRNGEDPKLPNSQLRWLLGYEQEVATNLTAAMQYYLEWTQDYDALKRNAPQPEYITDEFRHVLTMRLTWLTMQQNLIGSLFTFWSPNDNDAYLKPSLTYRINDNWSVATGANLFFGEEKHTFFGQHEKNSNAWLRVRLNY